jgi:hypothetical protein
MCLSFHVFLTYSSAALSAFYAVQYCVVCTVFLLSVSVFLGKGKLFGREWILGEGSRGGCMGVGVVL